MEKINRLIFSFLLAAIVFTGCATQRPDPLIGWQIAFKEEPNQTIEKDYQDYIQKIPTRKKEFVVSVHFLKNDAGEHAIDIGTGANGRYWRHILIYDKNDKRIKVIEYKTGWYRS
jgi:hypothetical protein